MDWEPPDEDGGGTLNYVLKWHVSGYRGSDAYQTTLEEGLEYPTSSPWYFTWTTDWTVKTISITVIVRNEAEPLVKASGESDWQEGYAALSTSKSHYPDPSC